MPDLLKIAFLVFLNSSLSFVITNLIGQRTKVGDAVGSLSFADELVALVACPAWGVISDRLGVRAVSWSSWGTLANSIKHQNLNEVDGVLRPPME